MTHIIHGFIGQLRCSWRILLALYTFVALLFLGVALLSEIIPHLTIPDLVRDVASVGNLPFYAGSISQMGALLWSSTTTVCFFAFFSLRNMNTSRKESLNFLLFSGLLTGYLMLDDTFMLHDEIIPDYLKIIPEEAVILLLGAAVVAFLYFNWKEIMRSEYALLFLALGLFGISVFIDAIPTGWYENYYFIEKIEHLLEDGAKFAAIVTWLTFYARYGYQQFVAASTH